MIRRSTIACAAALEALLFLSCAEPSSSPPRASEAVSEAGVLPAEHPLLLVDWLSEHQLSFMRAGVHGTVQGTLFLLPGQGRERQVLLVGSAFVTGMTPQASQKVAYVPGESRIPVNLQSASFSIDIVPRDDLRWVDVQVPADLVIRGDEAFAS